MRSRNYVPSHTCLAKWNRIQTCVTKRPSCPVLWIFLFFFFFFFYLLLLLLLLLSGWEEVLRYELPKPAVCMRACVFVCASTVHLYGCVGGLRSTWPIFYWFGQVSWAELLRRDPLASTKSTLEIEDDLTCSCMQSKSVFLALGEGRARSRWRRRSASSSSSQLVTYLGS